MSKTANEKESKNCANCHSGDIDSTHNAFFREVEEDLQREQLKKFWEKYGTIVVILVIAGLSFAAGFEGWKAWRMEIRQRDSISYENARILVEQKKFEEAVTALDEVSKEAKTGYALIASMDKASLLIEMGKEEEGLLEMEKIYNNKKVAKHFRDLAAIKIAGYILDDGDREKILSLIDPLTEPNSAWRGLALEIKGLLFLREGQKDVALNYFNSIIKDASISQGIKTRAVEMVSVLEESSN